MYGARPLKWVLRKSWRTRVALALLDGRYDDGDTVKVDVSDGELALR